MMTHLALDGWIFFVQSDSLWNDYILLTSKLSSIHLPFDTFQLPVSKVSRLCHFHNHFHFMRSFRRKGKTSCVHIVDTMDSRVLVLNIYLNGSWSTRLKPVRYNPDGWQVFSALHEFLYILISQHGLQLRHCLWNPVCPKLIPPFPESLRLFHRLLSKQEIYRHNTGKSTQLMFTVQQSASVFLNECIAWCFAVISSKVLKCFRCWHLLESWSLGLYSNGLVGL